MNNVIETAALIISAEGAADTVAAAQRAAAADCYTPDGAPIRGAAAVLARACADLGLKASKDTVAKYACAGLVMVKDAEGDAWSIELRTAIESAISAGLSRDKDVRPICVASDTVGAAIAALRSAVKAKKAEGRVERTPEEQITTLLTSVGTFVGKVADLCAEHGITLTADQSALVAAALAGLAGLPVGE